MPELLTYQNFIAAASKLKCEIAAIRAVSLVESSGAGFVGDRITILFEGHQFYRYADKTKRDRWLVGWPNICYKSWTTKFYAQGRTPELRQDGEWARFTQAAMLDSDAAKMAASYGRFQVMGFNFAMCGFATVSDFVTYLSASEGNQLDAFCEYIIHAGLGDALRNRDWAVFAEKYNGPAWRRNNYAGKLAKAYAKVAD